MIYSRLNILGYRVGMRVLELMVWRVESSSKDQGPQAGNPFLASFDVHSYPGVEPRQSSGGPQTPSRKVWKTKMNVNCSLDLRPGHLTPAQI